MKPMCSIVHIWENNVHTICFTNYHKGNGSSGAWTQDISFARRLLYQLRYRSDVIALVHSRRGKLMLNTSNSGPEFYETVKCHRTFKLFIQFSNSFQRNKKNLIIYVMVELNNFLSFNFYVKWQLRIQINSWKFYSFWWWWEIVIISRERVVFSHINLYMI